VSFEEAVASLLGQAPRRAPRTRVSARKDRSRPERTVGPRHGNWSMMAHGVPGARWIRPLGDIFTRRDCGTARAERRFAALLPGNREPR
jgi:hypothetical protein